jgi:hypothetical protein
MQKARGHPLPRRAIGLPLTVGTWFQVLFTPLNGVLFTFPSRYSFTIGHQLVFSLGRWSSRLPTGFLVSRGTRAKHPGRAIAFAYGAVTLCGAPSQTLRLPMAFLTPREVRSPLRCSPTTPRSATPASSHADRVWALPRSLAATRRISVDFSCLRVLRCFTSPRSPPKPMDSVPDDPVFTGIGFPHSDIPGSKPV